VGSMLGGGHAQLIQLLNSKSGDPINSSVFISNLDYDMSWQKVKDMFRRAGNCIRCELAQGDDNRSKGFGSAQFETPFEALTCIAMFNGMEIGRQHRKMSVRLDRASALHKVLEQLGVPSNEVTEKTIQQLQSIATLATLTASSGLGGGVGGGLGGGLGALAGIGGLGGVGALSQLSALTQQQPAQPSSTTQALSGLAGLGGLGGALGSLQALLTAGGLGSSLASLTGGGGVSALQQQQSATSYGSSSSGVGGGYGSFGGGYGQSSNRRDSVGGGYGNSGGRSDGRDGGSRGGNRDPPCAPGCRVFVRNLPFSIKWQDLKDKFRDAGPIKRADVKTNEDGRSKGCGTVTFDCPEDANRAVSLYNGSRMDGRDIEVKIDQMTN